MRVCLGLPEHHRTTHTDTHLPAGGGLTLTLESCGITSASHMQVCSCTPLQAGLSAVTRHVRAGQELQPLGSLSFWNTTYQNGVQVCVRVCVCVCDFVYFR